MARRRHLRPTRQAARLYYEPQQRSFLDRFFGCFFPGLFSTPMSQNSAHTQRQQFAQQHGEGLHISERQSWATISKKLRKQELSIKEFYDVDITKVKKFEVTQNDAAHTDIARTIALKASQLLQPFVPDNKKAVLDVVHNLCLSIKNIEDAALRRKVKFAVDRLLRDNEYDITAKMSARQLLLGCWSYLMKLEGGPNRAELDTFWLSLSVYIDSGDYPNASIGDVGTRLSFKLGVFAGDEEVKSDAGLHPACYSRMRNIDSAILQIADGVNTNQRMISVACKVNSQSLRPISTETMAWLQKTYEFLNFISEHRHDFDSYLDELRDFLEEGLIDSNQEIEFLQFLNQNGVEIDVIKLQGIGVTISELDNIDSKLTNEINNILHKEEFELTNSIQTLLHELKQQYSGACRH